MCQTFNGPYIHTLQILIRTYFFVFENSLKFWGRRGVGGERERGLISKLTNNEHHIYFLAPKTNSAKKNIIECTKCRIVLWFLFKEKILLLLAEQNAWVRSTSHFNQQFTELPIKSRNSPQYSNDKRQSNTDDEFSTACLIFHFYPLRHEAFVNNDVVAVFHLHVAEVLLLSIIFFTCQLFCLSKKQKDNFNLQVQCSQLI